MEKYHCLVLIHTQKSFELPEYKKGFNMLKKPFPNLLVYEINAELTPPKALPGDQQKLMLILSTFVLKIKAMIINS